MEKQINHTIKDYDKLLFIMSKVEGNILAIQGRLKQSQLTKDEEELKRISIFNAYLDSVELNTLLTGFIISAYRKLKCTKP